MDCYTLLMAIYLTISQLVVQDVDVVTAGRLRDVFGTSTSATPSRSRRLRFFRFFTFSSGSKKWSRNCLFWFWIRLVVYSCYVLCNQHVCQMK